MNGAPGARRERVAGGSGHRSTLPPSRALTGASFESPEALLSQPWPRA